MPGQGTRKAVRVCLQCYDAVSKVSASALMTNDSFSNKDQQRNSADSSGGDSSGDDDDTNKEKHDEVKTRDLIKKKKKHFQFYII